MHLLDRWAPDLHRNMRESMHWYQSCGFYRGPSWILVLDTIVNIWKEAGATLEF